MILTLFSSVWLGILTSISPCPLTTNIAAVSFIGQKVENPFSVFLSGALYTLGRIVFYVLLGFLLSLGVSSVPLVSQFLQLLRFGCFL